MPEWGGNGNGPDFVDAANGFRSRAGRWNDWGMDRQRQKSVNFSGILGINQQDRAVQESMGRIVDRSREHLGPADRAIIVMRQLLLDGVRTVREGGDPPGVGDNRIYVGTRDGHVVGFGAPVDPPLTASPLSPTSPP